MVTDQMRPFILLSGCVVALLTSCDGVGNQANYEFSKEQEHSLLVGDYLFVAKSVHAPFCDTASFMVINSISPLARSIANDETFSLENDSLALALLDSMLDGRDVATRRFYFWVVTKSLKRSDGYYSEGVGHAGTEFLFKQPSEFIDVWANCIDADEQRSWAWYLAAEENIRSEGYSVDLVMNGYRHRLDSATKDLPSSLFSAKTELIHRIDSVYRELAIDDRPIDPSEEEN